MLAERNLIYQYGQNLRRLADNDSTKVPWLAAQCLSESAQKSIHDIIVLKSEGNLQLFKIAALFLAVMQSFSLPRQMSAERFIAELSLTAAFRLCAVLAWKNIKL